MRMPKPSLAQALARPLLNSLPAHDSAEGKMQLMTLAHVALNAVAFDPLGEASWRCWHPMTRHDTPPALAAAPSGYRAELVQSCFREDLLVQRAE